MKIIIKKDYDALSKAAATIIKQRILEKSNLVLGLATGSTPQGTYKELIKMYQKQGLDFSWVTTFNLDEYVDLASSHSQSYHYYMEENFFKYINIKKKNIFIPDGEAADVKEYCHWYENQIKKKGGVDLQILGIGRDGHIGFNEPGSAFNSRTRIVGLDQMTLRDNARFFYSPNQVPQKAITMGIGTILEARECFLLVNGEHKADIIYKAVRGPITLEIPATALQKHKNLTVILDKEAAKLLNN